MAEQKASAFLAESMKNGTIVAGGGGRRQGKEGKCKGKERKGKICDSNVYCNIKGEL